MLKKVTVGKGISVVLVISMFGMGAPSLPLAYAAGGDLSSASVVQNVQNANQLSSLEIEGTAFDQTFSPELYQYTATVEYNVQNVTLMVKSDNEKATITINGQAIKDDGTSQPIPLQTGDNQISITVDDGVHTAAIYHLTVTRKKSSNNLLQDLQLSAGELSPAFNPATTSYSAQVGNEVNSLTVKPVAAESTESIKVNDKDDADQGVTVQLPTAQTDITVLVTAENGDQKTYTINVAKKDTSSNGSASPSVPSSGPSGGNSRPQNSNVTHLKNTSAFSLRNMNAGAAQTQGSQQGNAAVQKPSMATLSSLSVSTGTWNKTFSKDTFTYHIAVGNDIDSVTIGGTTTYSAATVTVGDGTSHTISLGEQKKTIVPVVVTKDDERKTYILVFDKDVTEAAPATAAAQTVSSIDTQAQTPSVQASNRMPNANNWKGRNNTNSESTSFWSRLIESIRSFFSKL